MQGRTDFVALFASPLLGYQYDLEFSRSSQFGNFIRYQRNRVYIRLINLLILCRLSSENIVRYSSFVILINSRAILIIFAVAVNFIALIL